MFKKHKRNTPRYALKHQNAIAARISFAQQLRTLAIVPHLLRIAGVIAQQLNTTITQVDAVRSFIFQTIFIFARIKTCRFKKVSRNTYNEDCVANYMCVPNKNLVCYAKKCLCIKDYYWTGSTCSIAISLDSRLISSLWIVV